MKSFIIKKTEARKPLFCWQGQQESNPQPTVLETAKVLLFKICISRLTLLYQCFRRFTICVNCLKSVGIFENGR